MTLLSFLVAGLVLAGAAAAQQKEMYRWTDENGVVHFSDTRPLDREVQAEALPPGEAPATSDNPYAAVAEEAESGAEVAEERRQEIAQRSEAARTAQAQQAAQCAQMQDELARIEPNRRVFFTNAQGETERMDDVQRTERVAELKALIAERCK